MKRTYTLTIEEYLRELKHASESKQAMLIAAAKKVDDNHVQLTIDGEEI